MNPVPYDFRRPVRLPPALHKLLQGWFQTSNALATRGWAKQLLVPLELGDGPLEDWHAQDALAALPGDSIGQHIMIGEGRLPTMLVLPRSLLVSLAGVMLGDGQTQEDRELTVVEEELADYFLVNHWLPYFRESWPGPTPLPWQLQQREVQPSFSRLFAPGDVLLTLHWQIRGPFGDVHGQWLFPRQALVQALTNEQQQTRETTGSADKDAAARKAQLVRTLPLSLECILGTAQLRLSELSRLQVGDVLLLDQRTADNVLVVSQNAKLFRGQAGRNGSWKAFRIESFIEK
jgi:flagellar motor switch protein FliM